VIGAFLVGVAAGAAVRTLWETPARAAPTSQWPAIGGYQLVPVRDSLVAPYLVDASTGQGWRYEAGLLSRAWDARTAPADRSPERCSVRSTRKEAAW
jgi:hypothetical protein